MERTGKIIIRGSIYTFLQQYQYFTSTSAVLAFPFAASILLSQALVSSSPRLLQTINARSLSLLEAAGFPLTSNFFSFLNLKLSQTIFSSLFTLPFTLSFLHIAKASVIRVLSHQNPILPPHISSIASLYKRLLLTYICTSFLILSANATAFSIIFVAFNCLEGFGLSSSSSILFLSAASAVLYSVILANALVVCNLALVSSGMEKSSGGYLAILKACVMIRGRNSLALLLALPANMGMAAVEALFQYRIIRPSHLASRMSSAMALEAVGIAYLYSILIVLDTIMSCIFFRSCKTDCCWVDVDQERYVYRVDAPKHKGSDLADSKSLSEIL